MATHAHSISSSSSFLQQQRQNNATLDEIECITVVSMLVDCVVWNSLSNETTILLEKRQNEIWDRENNIEIELRNNGNVSPKRIVNDQCMRHRNHFPDVSRRSVGNSPNYRAILSAAVCDKPLNRFAASSSNGGTESLKPRLPLEVVGFTKQTEVRTSPRSHTISNNISSDIALSKELAIKFKQHCTNSTLSTTSSSSSTTSSASSSFLTDNISKTRVINKQSITFSHLNKYAPYSDDKYHFTTLSLKLTSPQIKRMIKLNTNDNTKLSNIVSKKNNNGNHTRRSSLEKKSSSISSTSKFLSNNNTKLYAFQQNSMNTANKMTNDSNKNIHQNLKDEANDRYTQLIALQV